MRFRLTKKNVSEADDKPRVLCLIFKGNPLLEIDKYLNASSGYCSPLKIESHCRLPTLMANLQIVPARKNVEAQHVEMMVPLYSFGCEKKIKKALSHFRGIHSVDVDYKLQKVTVWGICNKYDVLATIRKKRREAHFWGQTEDDSSQTENESETEGKKGGAVKEVPCPAKFNYKFSKSWKKKLFPLMLYLN